MGNALEDLQKEIAKEEENYRLMDTALKYLEEKLVDYSVTTNLNFIYFLSNTTITQTINYHHPPYVKIRIHSVPRRYWEEVVGPMLYSITHGFRITDQANDPDLPNMLHLLLELLMEEPTCPAS